MMRVFCVCIALVGLVERLQADNWPQFRGPGGQGHSAETQLPTTWSRSDHIAWKTEIPGESWSSPIVWGDRVFVTTATEEGRSCRLVAIDRQSGQLLWNKEVHRQELRRKEQRNTYATPTPATDGARVYACFGDGCFVATDYDGNVVWVNLDYPFYSQHGLGSSPILVHDLLIMARDGSSDGDDLKLGWQTPWDQAYLVALDSTTGRERWKASRGLSRISHGTPCIWERDGVVQLVSEAGDVVQGFDVDSGERLWSSTVIGEGKVPSTVLGDGLVFTAGGWGGRESIKAFRLGTQGALDETNLVWEQKRGMPKLPSMLYLPPYLLAVTDNGVVSCLRAQTGDLLWQERLGGNYTASPVAAAGRVYITSDDGKTSVLQVGEQAKVLAVNPLEEQVQASLAISQGSLFLRTAQALYRIDDRP